jgi:hypothetical protein
MRQVFEAGHWRVHLDRVVWHGMVGGLPRWRSVPALVRCADVVTGAVVALVCEHGQPGGG